MSSLSVAVRSLALPDDSGDVALIGRILDALKIANADFTEGQAAGYGFDRLAVTHKCNFKYISAAATNANIASGPCILRSITIGETAAGAITIYNSLAGSGEIICVLKASIAEGTYFFDVSCDIGLTIVTAGASKLSVHYTPVGPTS